MVVEHFRPISVPDNEIQGLRDLYMQKDWKRTSSGAFILGRDLQRQETRVHGGFLLLHFRGSGRARTLHINGGVPDAILRRTPPVLDISTCIAFEMYNNGFRERNEFCVRYFRPLKSEMSAVVDSIDAQNRFRPKEQDFVLITYVMAMIIYYRCKGGRSLMYFEVS